jgi:hypothetical protein
MVFRRRKNHGTMRSEKVQQLDPSSAPRFAAESPQQSSAV